MLNPLHFLRRGMKAKPATREDAPVPAQQQPEPEVKAVETPSLKPIGWWRCTHAEEWAQAAGFIPGRAYPCRDDGNRHISSPRIYPYEGSSWSPYWVERDGAFCYRPEKMAFEYLGRLRPQGADWPLPSPGTMAARPKPPPPPSVEERIAAARAEGRAEAFAEAAHVCGILAKANEKRVKSKRVGPSRRKTIARAAALRVAERSIRDHAGGRPWTTLS